MLTKAKMRELVRKGLGNLDEKDMPNPEVDTLLDLSFAHLWQKFEHKERECISYVETADGVSDYRLDEDNIHDSIISVAIKDGVKADEGDWRKLNDISIDEYDKRHTTEADARGKPTAYNRIQHTVRVDPVPDSTVYTIRITFWRTVDSFITGKAGETTELPPEWDELVVQGAIARGHFYEQDYNEAAAASNFQDKGVRDAVLTKDREARDSKWAGLKVIRDDPEIHDQ